jgi:hypothetical protein
MRHNRSEMKPFPTCGDVTIAPVAKMYVFSYRSLLFSDKRLSANFCADSQNSGSTNYFTICHFVKKN